MNPISLNRTPTWTTSDGTPFTDRAAALAHETYLQRLKNLNCADLSKASELLYETNDDHISGEILESKDIVAFIAKNADAILAALTVKQRVGRGASKKAAA